MTNPTLERAANAAADAAGKTGTYVEADGDLDCLTVDGLVDFYAVVRAVLMAVRQTNEEMFLKQEGLRGGDWYTDGRSAAFMDMIDAILAEGE